MTTSPRTYNEALRFARSESTDSTQNWEGYCQRFVRTAYGIPGMFESAWAQWNGADEEDRHPGSNPDEAPLGAALCFKGGTWGHIMLAARSNQLNNLGAWSNDLIRSGEIDWVDRRSPETQWGQQYVGYVTAVNDYDLQLKEQGAPVNAPKPKHTKRYAAVDRAIQRLEVALATAERDKDKHDVRLFKTEIAHLKDLYDALRHV